MPLTSSFILVFGGIAAAQSEFTGKIVSDIELPPACGIFAFAYVIEIEVIDSPNFPHSNTVPIIIPCPEFYGEGYFVNGQTYRFKVSDENSAEFEWSIVGEAVLQKHRLEKRLYMINSHI